MLPPYNSPSLLKCWCDFDNMERVGEATEIRKDDDASKKIRITSRPPLSRRLISAMIDFLIQEDHRPIPDNTPVWTQSWLELLLMDTEIKQYTKGLSVRSRFLTWLRLLDVLVTDDGIHHLCLAGSNRIVPCKEEFQKIIRDAHRSTGEFEASTSEKNSSTLPQHGHMNKHNSAEKCIKMVSGKLTIGNGEANWSLLLGNE